MGITHLRAPVQVLCNCSWLWVRRCHFVGSCVLGDGISDDRSLEDVRGDRSFSPKDGFLSDLTFFGMEFLTDEYNSSESTGVSSVQLRMAIYAAMPLC